MSRPAKLSAEEQAREMLKLPRWNVEDGKLHREYVFADFASAFGFMTAAALMAQSMDHHPDWSNAHNTVRVDLVTHDAGGITQLDVKLAGLMEDLACRLVAK